MSLKPSPIDEIPEETVEVVRDVFPKGNRYMTLRDQLGTIYQDEDFASAALFALAEQIGRDGWRLLAWSEGEIARPWLIELPALVTLSCVGQPEESLKRDLEMVSE